MTADFSEPFEQPTERDVAFAFLRKLAGTYDVAEAILFGSRARGDHRPDSDLDLAIVLHGRRGDFIETKLDMAGIAFDVLLEMGVLVQPFPLWDGDLAHPDRFANPSMIHKISQAGQAGGYQAGMTIELMNKAERPLTSAKLLLDAGDSDGATNRASDAMKRYPAPKKEPNLGGPD